MPINDFPVGGEFDAAYRDLEKKREASSKKRAEQNAAKEPLLAKAKETFERDMAKAKAIQGQSGEMARKAIAAKYSEAVEEISGVGQLRRTADARYRKQHGHNPDPEFTRREFDSAQPGGLGSPTAAIHDFIRETASEAVEMSKEESRTTAPSSFNFDYRSDPASYHKAFVAGKQVEHKTFAALQTKVVNESKGILETLFSVTGNVDRGSDRIEPGAFERTIQQIKSGVKPWPALLYGHQMDSLASVMGSIIDLEEIRPGDTRLPQRLQQNGWGAVRATARFNLKTTAGRDGFELASAGDLPSWSFAYVPGDFSFVGKGDNQVRSLQTIDELFECSLVVVPMNPEARTLSTVAGMKSGVSELRIDRIQAAVLERVTTLFNAWRTQR